MDTKLRAAVVLFVRRDLNAEPLVLAVTNRHYGGFGLPGGKAEPEEETRLTACREVLEETGITIVARDLTLLAKADSVRPESTREVSLYFARFSWGAAKDLEPGTVCRWMTFPELLELSPFAAFYRKWLPDGVTHLRSTIFHDVATVPR